jgi:hypothetical protein
MRRALHVAVWAVMFCALWGETTQAQVVGTFRWQLLPFCNVVTVTVVQVGASYTLQGRDDQCGGFAAGVTGVAFVQPLTAQITLAFDTVHNGDPGRVLPIHTDATISLASRGGSWRDSSGLTGSFTFTPGNAVPGGSARPRTRRVSLGSWGTNVTIAANSCIVRDQIGGIGSSVAAGDLIVPTPQIMPAGAYVLPVIAGTNGRYGVMYCNGTSAPMTSVFIAVALEREPK